MRNPVRLLEEIRSVLPPLICDDCSAWRRSMSHPVSHVLYHCLAPDIHLAGNVNSKYPQPRWFVKEICQNLSAPLFQVNCTRMFSPTTHPHCERRIFYTYIGLPVLLYIQLQVPMAQWLCHRLMGW